MSQESPIELSKHFQDTPSKKAQTQTAINYAYARLNQRYRHLFLPSVQPRPEGMLLCENSNEFIAIIQSLDPKSLVEYPAEVLKSFPGFTLPEKGKSVLNLRLIESPWQVAMYAIEFMIPEMCPSPASIRFNHPLVTGRFHNHLPKLRELVGYSLAKVCAFESFSLLDSDLRILPTRELMAKAIDVMTIRQLAVVFGKDALDTIFRISQGTFTEAEIEKLNNTVGPHPDRPTWNSYYEIAFLCSIGAITPELYHLSPADVQTTWRWLSHAQGLERPEYLTRPDVQALGLGLQVSMN